ncbi:MAG TPA: hypothetical protein VFK05_19965 [Polyangiaceae bacterium]|nr:hypothetical protein [Polyangiaceae bacterium]
MGARSLSRHAKYLWLLVPLFGLGELGASVYFSKRAPQFEEWRGLSPEVRARKKDGDLIVIAPEWAEPLARTAFSDSLLPIFDVARADESGYPRALEIAALGSENPLVAAWPVISQEQIGKFSLRTRKNPRFSPPLFVLTDHALPSELTVSERGPSGESRECRYGTRPPSSASGLLARPAFPRQRFSCGPGEGNFVGTTIIEDQHDRARRCLWANPAPGGLLTLNFAHVPLADWLDGYIGFPYFRFRDPGWPKVTVAFAIDGVALGTHDHLPESGWQPFRLSTAQFRGSSAEVRIQIFGADSRELELCFYAATR